MAQKSKEQLQAELPILIKTKNLVSPTKTTGDSLREMLLDIIDSMGYGGEGVPEGGIIEWSGSIANIPQYWVLCDGRFGTPDLRDKFVIGAGLNYAVDATGGSTIHSHTGTVGLHALTIEEMPNHDHGTLLPYDGGGSTDMQSLIGTGNWDERYLDGPRTSSEGGGQGHNHPLTLDSVSTLPPYHSLAFIMFKGVNFTGDTEVPSQVLNITVTNNTLSSFLVSWDASTDNVAVFAYDVYINGAYRNSTSTLSLLVTGLGSSTTYTVMVKARDAVGNTSIDASTTGTTLALPYTSVEILNNATPLTVRLGTHKTGSTWNYTSRYMLGSSQIFNVLKRLDTELSVGFSMDNITFICMNENNGNRLTFVSGAANSVGTYTVNPDCTRLIF